MMLLLHELHNTAFFDRIKKKYFDKLEQNGQCQAGPIGDNRRDQPG
jgi:hypothetical protein